MLSQIIQKQESFKLKYYTYCKSNFAESETGINVSQLAAGVYIVEVNDGQKTVAKKFVKN
ncbi:T9SS type A sorting domain-containing protein [Flavobacterium frigoris]|uniref:Por secretion system C-terminal sorting domain-containing protein n=1 Tax=Flavobacterium frigoris TaxID=229204 RepID=A0A1H9C9W7_FLAFI|nr:T9SS type A sorting domain-containing protein [Flavobacterium frigoris]SEP97781.1 Por secretion system C-terminal sorting domain-containing protein [Flavobacterium frigoris]